MSNKDKRAARSSLTTYDLPHTARSSLTTYPTPYPYGKSDADKSITPTPANIWR